LIGVFIFDFKKSPNVWKIPIVGGLPPIEAEILFVFFSKTKRLECKAGIRLGGCPKFLVQVKIC
jgi:hypothetical protein